jgi:hypothetical protein
MAIAMRGQVRPLRLLPPGPAAATFVACCGVVPQPGRRSVILRLDRTIAENEAVGSAAIEKAEGQSASCSCTVYNGLRRARHWAKIRSSGTLSKPKGARIRLP